MNDKQRVFCHRGLWDSRTPANSTAAIENALDAGFSLETDLRDHCGEIVVSHDPVKNSEDLITLSKLRNMARAKDGYLALNIKSDGLVSLIRKQEANEFFFDMSSPEAIRYRNAGFDVALRLSDFEPEIVPKGLPSRWLWLDGFQDDWFLKAPAPIFDDFDRIVVVSPELHGREKTNVWTWVADNWRSSDKWCICTDYPLEFMRFLNDEK